jgi:hypothetical protein
MIQDDYEFVYGRAPRQQASITVCISAELIESARENAGLREPVREVYLAYAREAFDALMESSP